MDIVSRSREILCGGDRNFAFTTDRSTGTVVAADLSLSEKDDIFKSYLFRSVFEKTSLEPAKTLEELGPVADEIIYLSKGREQVEEAERYSFQEAANELPCGDLVSTSAAHKEAFLERSERSSNVSNCSQLEGSLCHVGLRPFCPVACGCTNPSSGLYNRLGCSTQCDLIEETAFQRRLGLLLQLNMCEDGGSSDGDQGAHLEAYFEEVQQMLLHEHVLKEFPDQAPNFIWASDETVLNVLGGSFFQAFLLVNNMTLGKWARTGFENPRSQNAEEEGEPGRCGMVAFVYKVFKVDLCDTRGSSLFQGRVGSIRHICMKTCGYCSDQALPYKETTWWSLAAWTGRVLDFPLLQAQNFTDMGSECLHYKQFPDIKQPQLDAWCNQIS